MKSEERLEELASEIKSLPPHSESPDDFDVAVKCCPEEQMCVICVTVPVANASCSDLLIRALNQDENGFRYAFDDGKLSVFAQMFESDHELYLEQFSDITAMLIASAKVARMMIMEVNANARKQ